jgi:hypothetical protein
VSAVFSLTPRLPDRDALARAAARHHQGRGDHAVAVAALRRWAPTRASANAVTAWASAHGLHVDHAGGWSITVSAAPDVIARAFGVQLVQDRSFFEPNGPARYLRAATAPQVPAELRSAARSVIGLDERPVVRSHATGSDGHQPATLRSAYSQLGGTTAGTGITVATVQFAPWRPSVLTTWAANKGIADPIAGGRVTTVSVNGAPATCTAGNCTNSGEVEVALDTEMILAAAPASSQRVYVGGNNAAGLVDTYSAIADDAESGAVQVASSSWGSCEWQYTKQGQPGLDLLADVRTQVQRIVSAGATLFAATGDFGSNDCFGSSGTPPSTAVDAPASFPETIATGGTALTSSTLPVYDPDPACATGFCEYGWGDGNPANGGSGGGNSAVYTRPSYQSGVLTGAGNVRMLPDISAVGDPNTGLSTFSDNFGWAIIGGTSAAAPINAGMLAAALWNQGMASGAGDIHTQLYGAPSTDFRDGISGAYPAGSATSGDNGVYTAVVGYDRVTGLGSPLWQALVPDLGLTPSTYHTRASPTRVMDTRDGTGTGVGIAPIPSKGKVTLTLPGFVPVGVSSVVINVTVPSPSKGSFLTVFPGTGAAPNSSNINFTAGTTIANLVTVQVRADRRVSFYNNAAAAVHALADMAGYYLPNENESTYHALEPTRVLDTRLPNNTGPPVPAQTSHLLTLPATIGTESLVGADSVVLSVIAVGPTAGGHLTVYPGPPATPPTASNLNFATTKTVPNLVAVGIDSQRRLSIYNSAGGTVHVVVDIAGFFTPDLTGGTFVPSSPRRIMDTRSNIGGVGSTPIGAHLQRALTLPSWVPVGVSAVVVNLAVTQATRSGFLTAFPGTGSPPTASNVNFVAGVTRANLAVVAVGADRTLSFYNGSSGTVHAFADLAGYYLD